MNADILIEGAGPAGIFTALDMVRNGCGKKIFMIETGRRSMRSSRDSSLTQTLLYSPELKFYGNRVKMDERLNANMEGLYCLGHSDAGRIGL